MAVSTKLQEVRRHLVKFVVEATGVADDVSCSVSPPQRRGSRPAVGALSSFPGRRLEAERDGTLRTPEHSASCWLEAGQQEG